MRDDYRAPPSGGINSSHHKHSFLIPLHIDTILSYVMGGWGHGMGLMGRGMVPIGLIDRLPSTVNASSLQAGCKIALVSWALRPKFD